MEGNRFVKPHELLYPAEFDRFRLISVLLRKERRDIGIDQDELTARCNSSSVRIVQMTKVRIANLETLQNTISNRTRKVERRHLLQIAAGGLQLKRMQLDVLLWLFDGNVLNQEEHIECYSRAKDDSNDRDISSESLRERAWKMLREVLDWTFQRQNGEHKAKVRIFAADEKSRVQADRVALTLARARGQRLLATEYPSHILTNPDEALAYMSDQIGSLSKRATDSISAANYDRYDALIESIKIYGERHIISKSSLEQFALYGKEGEGWDYGWKGDIANSQHRARRINELIGLLNTYGNYQIGLSPVTPELATEGKSLDLWMLRGMRRRTSTDPWPLLGPRYLAFDDETSALALLLCFEDTWYAIDKEDREKESVISWLTALRDRIEAQ